jgi:hypothetical protein
MLLNFKARSVMQVYTGDEERTRLPMLLYDVIFPGMLTEGGYNQCYSRSIHWLRYLLPVKS